MRVLLSRLIELARGAVEGRDPTVAGVPAGERRVARATPLRTIRAAGLAFGLVSALGLCAQLDNARSDRLLPGIAGFVGLAAVFILTYLRKHTFPGEPLLTVVLLFAAGVSLVDPLATSGLVFAVLLTMSVGRILDLEIVAEGVETTQQQAILCAAEVPLSQGYLFARPMPAPDFAAWSARSEATARVD